VRMTSGITKSHAPTAGVVSGPPDGEPSVVGGASLVTRMLRASTTPHT
jgi:hypothetical protein